MLHSYLHIHKPLVKLHPKFYILIKYIVCTIILENLNAYLFGNALNILCINLKSTSLSTEYLRYFKQHSNHFHSTCSFSDDFFILYTVLHQFAVYCCLLNP